MSSGVLGARGHASDPHRAPGALGACILQVDVASITCVLQVHVHRQRSARRRRGIGMSKSRRRSDCPIHFALEVFGDSWTLLIVRDLMFKGRTTYTERLRAEEGIATNILADRLARLRSEERRVGK